VHCFVVDDQVEYKGPTAATPRGTPRGTPRHSILY